MPALLATNTLSKIVNVRSHTVLTALYRRLLTQRRGRLNWLRSVCGMLIKSAVVARGTFVVCEYDASTGGEDLNEVSRKVLSKIPRTGAIRSYVYAGYTFNYVLEKDLIFLCIAAVAAGSELVFQFLNELKRNFQRLSLQLNGPNRSSELARMLKDMIGKYNSEQDTSKVRQMERELEDVTDMMRDNLSKVMERGERIESLIDKTNIFAGEAISFRKGAKRHNDAVWWQENRCRLIFYGCVTTLGMLTLWWSFRSVHHATPAPEQATAAGA
eukprot:TRINITY_DN36026_c0_g1_i2.p1 TRINITY_DN36026_c0_g1~~TRINITY_DN36026_c0_g1_i2.p1  ORF type:complete len:271 (-),score=34.24 TRINITY_DN36026_c0_g1_i2:41-853(-)